ELRVVLGLPHSGAPHAIAAVDLGAVEDRFVRFAFELVHPREVEAGRIGIRGRRERTESGRQRRKGKRAKHCCGADVLDELATIGGHALCLLGGNSLGIQFPGGWAVLAVLNRQCHALSSMRTLADRFPAATSICRLGTTRISMLWRPV